MYAKMAHQLQGVLSTLPPLLPPAMAVAPSQHTSSAGCDFAPLHEVPLALSPQEHSRSPPPTTSKLLGPKEI